MASGLVVGEEEARVTAERGTVFRLALRNPQACAAGRLVPSSNHPTQPASLTPPSTSHSHPTLSPLSSSPSREWPLIFGDTHPTTHLGAEWMRGPRLKRSPQEDLKTTLPVWGSWRPWQRGRDSPSNRVALNRSLSPSPPPSPSRGKKRLLKLDP